MAEIDDGGFPVPPEELINRVTGSVMAPEAFLESGRRSLSEFANVLDVVGRPLDSFDAILDYGCGCGRVLRFLAPLADGRAVHGCDTDKRATQWVTENLPFAQAVAVSPHPPTPYPDDTFDLVIGHSVFSHLDEHLQDNWLAELRRISRPGAILLLTISGPAVFRAQADARAQLDPAEVARWELAFARSGFLFVESDALVGGPLGEWYHTTFHHPRYVLERWGRLFHVRGVMRECALGTMDIVVLERRGTDEPSPEVSLRDELAGLRSALTTLQAAVREQGERTNRLESDLVES